MKKKFSSGDDGDAGDAASPGEKCMEMRHLIRRCCIFWWICISRVTPRPKKWKKNFHQDMLEMEMREMPHLLERSAGRCGIWSGDAASPDGYASPDRLLDPKNEKKNFIRRCWRSGRCRILYRDMVWNFI
jgi:hypothetical protein